MIRISKSILDGIIEQAKNELPNEACGLLAGKENCAIKQIAMTNADHSPEHFSFDPAEQFQALRAARAEGLELIANYHSHPETPARPSQEDIKLAYDPDIVYFILSLANDLPNMKAFRIQNGNAKEEIIEIAEKVEMNK